MKVAVVVISVLAGVLLQTSSHPTGEAAAAETAEDVGSESLTLVGGCTVHTFVAQIANLLVTISPKPTIIRDFGIALLEAIKNHASGQTVSMEEALTELIKGKQSFVVKIATLIAAFTSSKVSWKEINITVTKVFTYHWNTIRYRFLQFLESNKYSMFEDIFRHIHKSFSKCI